MNGLSRHLCALLLVLGACGSPVQEAVKTTFQTSQGWRPTLDNRADAVMVYGVGTNLEERLASWQEKGYQTHFMTGIAGAAIKIISPGPGTAGRIWTKAR